MSYEAYLRHFTAELRRNPTLPCPELLVTSKKSMADWKEQCRAYDAARIALGLSTPEAVQRENSCARVNRNTARIVEWPKFDL